MLQAEGQPGRELSWPRDEGRTSKEDKDMQGTPWHNFGFPALVLTKSLKRRHGSAVKSTYSPSEGSENPSPNHEYLMPSSDLHSHPHRHGIHSHRHVHIKYKWVKEKEAAGKAKISPTKKIPGSVYVMVTLLGDQRTQKCLPHPIGLSQGYK